MRETVWVFLKTDRELSENFCQHNRPSTITAEAFEAWWKRVWKSIDRGDDLSYTYYPFILREVSGWGGGVKAFAVARISGNLNERVATIKGIAMEKKGESYEFELLKGIRKFLLNQNVRRVLIYVNPLEVNLQDVMNIHKSTSVKVSTLLTKPDSPEFVLFAELPIIYQGDPLDFAQMAEWYILSNPNLYIETLKKTDEKFDNYVHRIFEFDHIFSHIPEVRVKYLGIVLKNPISPYKEFQRVKSQLTKRFKGKDLILVFWPDSMLPIFLSGKRGIKVITRADLVDLHVNRVFGAEPPPSELIEEWKHVFFPQTISEPKALLVQIAPKVLEKVTSSMRYFLKGYPIGSSLKKGDWILFYSPVQSGDKETPSGSIVAYAEVDDKVKSITSYEEAEVYYNEKEWSFTREDMRRFLSAKRKGLLIRISHLRSLNDPISYKELVKKLFTKHSEIASEHIHFEDLEHIYLDGNVLDDFLHRPSQPIEQADITTSQKLNLSHDHFELRNKIVEFLSSIPNADDRKTQQALIQGAGLDRQLQDQIDFAGSPAQFFPLLMPILSRYGILEDGRNALEAILEAAKNYVGHDRREYCDKLIQELHGVSH